MIENKEQTRALVIPKWLSNKAVRESKDYEIPQEKQFIIRSSIRDNFNKDYREFKNNPSPTLAGDILSSAITLDEKHIATEVAEYLYSYPNTISVTHDLAGKILGKPISPATIPKPNNLIHQLKQTLHRHPKNPLAWIELARIYTTKGQTQKAERAVIAAINLAPSDRFIVRAAFRFYVHMHDYEKAFYYVKKGVNFSADPWLRATEINAAILNDNKLKNVKKFDPNLIPSNKLFHYSELIESVGILDLIGGNSRKAKKNFKIAWADPSENVVAHGEWVIRNYFPSFATDADLDMGLSSEALAWHNYYRLQLKEALYYARSWILQEPYSTHPFLCASQIACLIGNPSESISLAQEGLIANPDDISLKNNLAFAHLKLNNIGAAKGILDTYPKALSDRDKIFNLATTGLLNFKKGDIELGRSLYQQSIELSGKIDDRRLMAKATLHLAIAELDAKTEIAVPFAQKALSFSLDITNPEIVLISQHIIDRINNINGSRQK